MIRAIALNIQFAAANNCMTETLDLGMVNPTIPRHWLPALLDPYLDRLLPRAPHGTKIGNEESNTLCSTVEYANVEYWKPGSTQRNADAWLTVHIGFEQPPVMLVWCTFLDAALGMVGDVFPELRRGRRWRTMRLISCVIIMGMGRRDRISGGVMG